MENTQGNTRKSLNIQPLKMVLKLMLVMLIAGYFQSCKVASEIKTNNTNLNALLWMQTSAEYKIICTQVYEAASKSVQKALADSNWTAIKEQCPDYQNLPPAIIVDVDETVLDNSPYFARLAKSGGSYSDITWNNWVNEEGAESIPGAREFIVKAKELEVKTFFVTNRTEELHTTENLKKVFHAGIMSEDVLYKNEKPGWGSDKVARRKEIGQKYRVLVLAGDDLNNDFTLIGKPDWQDRSKKLEEYRENFGQKWFLLPNPLYGSFEYAVLGYHFDLNKSEVIKLKFSALDTLESK